MKLIYSIALLGFLITSCSSNNSSSNSKSKVEFWDISKFNIDNNALTEYEEIKLLYSSRGLNYDQNNDYYIHIIAVSVASGDTVNILTPLKNGFKENDKDKIFNFMSKDNVATIAMMEQFQSLNKSKQSNSGLNNISKVIRDPNFDYLADNDYPTIIGMIGVFTKTE